LRWSLSKLRKVVDAPDRPRIIADRERVHFDAKDVDIDIRDIHARLRQQEGQLAVDDLEAMARQLDMVLLDGLDGAGDQPFESWLVSEREDAQAARVTVLRQLATHPEMAPKSGCGSGAMPTRRMPRRTRGSPRLRPRRILAPRMSGGPTSPRAELETRRHRDPQPSGQVGRRQAISVVAPCAHSGSLSARSATEQRLPMRPSGRGRQC
jgi:hypothetical protein